MRYNRMVFLFLSIVIFVACSFENYLSESSSKSFAVIVYYVPDKNIDVNSLPLGKLTHIIISFTEVADNRMVFPNQSNYKKLQQIVEAKKRYPGLKVMVACGGWGGSGGFSDMASTKKTRTMFVSSVVEFLEKYGIDGLDIDWEYPGMPGIGNSYRKEDKKNFTSLMNELRSAMDSTGKRYVLTFAAAGWKGYFHHIELNKVMKYVDYINMMTYDFEGGHTPVASHNTNLGKVGLFNLKSPAALIYYKTSTKSAEKIVNYVLNHGAEPGKVVVGCAFYGRGWKGVPPRNNGLYQPNNGYWQTVTYREIHNKYENKNSFVRYWDDIAKAPYLYNSADSIFISYDDLLSVKLKTKFAQENHLGGVMFWELRHDSEDNILLNSINTQVKLFDD